MKIPLALLTLFFAAGSAAADDDKAELKLFQGDWVLVSEITAGMDVPSEKLRGRKLVVRGAKYMFESPFTGGEEGTLVVDAAKKPHAIDMTPTDGPNKGKVRRGVYEIDGASLRLCYTPYSDDRPTALLSERGRKTVVIAYRRAKP